MNRVQLHWQLKQFLLFNGQEKCCAIIVLPVGLCLQIPQFSMLSSHLTTLFFLCACIKAACEKIGFKIRTTYKRLTFPQSLKFAPKCKIMQALAGWNNRTQMPIIGMACLMYSNSTRDERLGTSQHKRIQRRLIFGNNFWSFLRTLEGNVL
jgi:hypothetical protein